MHCHTTRLRVALKRQYYGRHSSKVLGKVSVIESPVVVLSAPRTK